MIFWTLTGAISAAITYDKREKKRATARWSKAVSHLANEPLANPNQLPRRLTIYLESPPTDGLRVAQDHFTEYVKPILAASGLDWEFVQGRKEGDVRAAVAERIRRKRRETEEPIPADRGELTAEEIVKEVRKRNNTPEWTGINGDVVIGRHTWKEYMRGLHEGWLGPLAAPPPPAKEELMDAQGETGESKEKSDEERERARRPPQPPPHNTTDDYPTSSLPRLIPAEFSPSSPIVFPHILGFSNTFTRLRCFLNRRSLANEIGREVAAVCLAHAREYREGETTTAEWEQQTVLEKEEKDWPKSVWQDKKEGEEETVEKIWTKPVIVDPRIAMRMRRFQIQPQDETRAKEIAVPEEETEGWIKGSLRSLYRWAVSDPPPKPYSSDD